MTTETPSAGVTPSAPSLLRSGVFSLATSAAPIVVALIAIPLLTRQLGTERLGLLALAWAWLGYAALLDFGLGRALTRMVAESDAGETIEAPIDAFIATAHVTLTVVGAIVGLLGALIAPWYVMRVLHVSDAMLTDAIVSGIVFAVTVPAVTGASVPRAVLEARQRFDQVNIVRLPVSIATFGVPLVLLPFTASLTVIALTLAAVRVWAWWRYAVLARDTQKSDARSIRASREYLRPLLRAGAWMTVSNVLSPLMTIADRFLIGSVISVSAVALYAVPWEAITKLLIVPGALAMVVFPALSHAATAHPDRMVPLHAAAVRFITLAVAPCCAIACLIAPWLLQLAGGSQYVGESVTVLRILSIGVMANCIAAVPFAVIQATGRARWTATIHLIEIIPYLLVLWFGVKWFGITGAATAWTFRAIADAAILTRCAQVLVPVPTSILLLDVGSVGAVALCALLGGTLGKTPQLPLFAVLAVVVCLPIVLWSRRPLAERRVLGRAGA